MFVGKYIKNTTKTAMQAHSTAIKLRHLIFFSCEENYDFNQQLMEPRAVKSCKSAS